MPHYGRHSVDYRNRARKLLDRDETESLFYAALEIRLGVEARMKEYLTVQDHVSKAKKGGWQVAKLGRNIESIFRIGDKLARFTVLNSETQEVVAVLHYTPVSKKLQGMVQRLGDYLHAPSPEAAWTGQWRSQFRMLLEAAWQELKNATSGQLLGVPLLHKKTGKMKMTVQFERSEDTNEYAKRLEAAGSQIILKVEYLDHFPEQQLIH